MPLGTPWSFRSYDPRITRDRRSQLRNDHYRLFLGDPVAVWHAASTRIPRVDLLEYPATEERPFWTYLTSGMSDVEQTLSAGSPEWVVPRTELMIYTEDRAPWAAKLLHGFARYPFDFATHFFWWHTVPVGGPIDGENAHLSSLVFLPPYFEEDGFDELVIDDAPVRTLWTVAITEAEREYAMVYGTHKLEQLFEKAQLSPITAPNRKSVI